MTKGQTTCGKQVVDGAKVFYMKATKGVPLEVSVDEIYKRGMRVDWNGYINAAKREGQKHKSIKAQVLEALAPHYSKTDIEVISIKLDELSG